MQEKTRRIGEMHERCRSGAQGQLGRSERQDLETCTTSLHHFVSHAQMLVLEIGNSNKLLKMNIFFTPPLLINNCFCDNVKKCYL